MTPIERAVSRRDLLRYAMVAGSTLPAVLSGRPLSAVEIPAGSPTPQPATPGHYLEAARRAAHWIRSTQVETPSGLLWVQGPERPEGFSVSYNIYSGGAGVVLFLLELARITGEKTYLEEAAAGADSLIATLPATLDPAQEEAGLYTGAAGVSFTLDRVAAATGKAAYHQAAERAAALLRAAAKPEGKGVSWGETNDIISGAAGIGLFLLYRAREHGDRAARDLAVQTGSRLIELGIPEAGGRKWQISPTSEHLMPNFSHGTAG
ncbi:MAG TPA: lanthionine synthetase LanC family protein, partial [Thermoanaerobaculia bacterium]|nr:lanthionine synthetase LanC family protein [Thermoanaerobaculia bacterium]